MFFVHNYLYAMSRLSNINNISLIVALLLVYLLDACKFTWCANGSFLNQVNVTKLAAEIQDNNNHSFNSSLNLGNDDQHTHQYSPVASFVGWVLGCMFFFCVCGVPIFLCFYCGWGIGKSCKSGSKK